MSYHVYIATNYKNSVLYTGVTKVYAEEFDSVEDAIAAEKIIKGWLREKKIKLIKSINPDFKDLSL